MTLFNRHMKASIVACIVATLVLGPGVMAADTTADSAPINIDVRDMEIGDVLRMLARAADANIIVGKGVTGAISSLTLRDVSVEMALRAITEANGYYWRRDGNIYFVTSEPSGAEVENGSSSDGDSRTPGEDPDGQPTTGAGGGGDVPVPPREPLQPKPPVAPEPPRIVTEMMPLSWTSANEVAALFGARTAWAFTPADMRPPGSGLSGMRSSSADNTLGSMSAYRGRLGGTGLPQFEGDIGGTRGTTGGLGGDVDSGRTTGTSTTGTGDTIELPGEMDITAIMSHNAILARGTREELDEFREMLNLLDIPQKQVEIATKWIDVQTTAAEALGIDWSVTNGAWEIFNLGFAPGEAANNGIRYGRGRWWAELSVLLNTSQATVINEPRVVCMNGMPGTIAFETEIPYFSATISYNQFGQRTVDYTSDSVTVSNELSVVPQINPDDSVKMLLAPQLEDQVGTVEGPNGERIPIVTSQYVETMVRVPDGETVVLGGVIRADESVNVRKTPLLNEIPIIGNLFRSKRVEKTNSELLIFVTPKIVRDASATY